MVLIDGNISYSTCDSNCPAISPEGVCTVEIFRYIFPSSTCLTKSLIERSTGPLSEKSATPKVPSAVPLATSPGEAMPSRDAKRKGTIVLSGKAPSQYVINALLTELILLTSTT